MNPLIILGLLGGGFWYLSKKKKAAQDGAEASGAQDELGPGSYGSFGGGGGSGGGGGGFIPAEATPPTGGPSPLPPPIPSAFGGQGVILPQSKGPAPGIVDSTGKGTGRAPAPVIVKSGAVKWAGPSPGVTELGKDRKKWGPK